MMGGLSRGPERAARFERRLADIAEAEERRRRRQRWIDAAGLGIPVLVRRLAARRGASAWDWQARRHRLFGDPSRGVQERDAPR